MTTFDFVVKDELGIHARPAGMLAKEAKKFQSIIKVKKGEKVVKAAQLLALMGLGVKKDDQVTVIVEGPDEELACADMQKFFEENL